VHRQIERLQ